MVNAEKWGAKINKWGDGNLLLPNVYVFQPCLPNFQGFKICVSWTPFYIFSFCCVSHGVV